MNSVTGREIVETGVVEILVGEQAAALVVETLAEEDLAETLEAAAVVEILVAAAAAVAEILVVEEAEEAVEILAVEEAEEAVEIFNKRNETSKDKSKAFEVVLACFVSLIGVY